MIVGEDELPDLAGIVTMVSGGFDPLHAGHIGYFRAATELGSPVLCNVSCDRYVNAKHPALLTQAERASVIDAIEHIDYTHLEVADTVRVLRLLKPKRFVKGSNWATALPIAELEACEELGIEVVFLDTVTASSTSILERYERGRSQPDPTA